MTYGRPARCPAFDTRQRFHRRCPCGAALPHGPGYGNNDALVGVAVSSEKNINENISLAKTITVTTRMRVDFRAEAFNVFNRIVWGAPTTSPAGGTDFNSANFGLINSLGNSPRQMQFGLKLYW